MVRAKKAPVAPYNTGNNEKIPDAPPGRPYGARADTEAAIAGSPLAGGSVPPVPPVQSAAPAPADPAAALSAAQGYSPAGALSAAQGYSPAGPGLTDPSANPNEPVTAGLATGPGAGPESLAMPDPTQLDTRAWAQYLPTLEYLASQPGSTASTRNFVRRLRAAIPPSTTR